MELVVLTSDQLKKLIDKAVRRAVEDALDKVLAQLEKQGGRKEWMTNREAMEYLGLSKTTLQRYRASGLLPYSKVGGSIYFRRSDINELLEDNRVDGAARSQGHT